MSDKPHIHGSEEGWRSASTDSRRHDKHRDIKSFIDRQIDNQNRVKEEHDNAFYDDLVEAAGPVVYAGLDKKGHAVGGGRNTLYQRNYDKWISSLGESR